MGAGQSTGQSEVTLLRDVVEELQGLRREVVDVRRELTKFYEAFVADETPPPNQAVTGHLSVTQLEGDTTVGQLTVDSAGVAHYQFDDDHGDIVAPPAGDGSGLVVTFASDDHGVATFANPVGELGTNADNGEPEYTAPTTFGVDGTFNLSAVVSNASTAALTDDDGVTAFVQADPVAVTVAAGQATTGTVSED